MAGNATYLLLLLPWIAPIVALHWWLAGDILRLRWRQVVIPTLAAGLYLSIADRVALGQGIWDITAATATGWQILGLPIEELLFFFLTSLMVAQSITLMTAAELTVAGLRQRFRTRLAALPASGRLAVQGFFGVMPWASLGAVLASLLALVLGAPPALTATSITVMDLTPLALAAPMLETIGTLSRPLGLLGGFALYLLIAGLTAGFARLGNVAALIAAGVALPLTYLYYASAAHPAPALLLALMPFTPAIIRAGRSAARQPEPQYGLARRRLLQVAPLVAAAGLGLIWFADRSLREIRTVGGILPAGSPLKASPVVALRDAGFAIPGLSPEVTPTSSFYVVSKNVEDPAPHPLTWRLRIDGLVERPQTIEVEQLLSLAATDRYVTLQCVSNSVGGPLMGNGWWTGVPLTTLLALAGVRGTATWALFRGLDGHFEVLPLPLLAEPPALVAYGLNGDLLDRKHGYPARLIAPGRYGFKHVKWLERIELVAGEPHGYWTGRGWTQLAEIQTGARIDVVRRQPGGGALAAGVALGGHRSVSAVDVRWRDGQQAGEWQPATLHAPPLGRETWVQWRHTLSGLPATPVTIECRAVDGLGQPQIVASQGQFPNGATGLHGKVLPA